MLSLLSLASAGFFWQLEVDTGMAALLEVGCLSPGCLFQSKFKARPILLVERCARQLQTSQAPFFKISCSWSFLCLKWNLIKRERNEIAKQSCNSNWPSGGQTQAGYMCIDLFHSAQIKLWYRVYRRGCTPVIYFPKKSRKWNNVSVSIMSFPQLNEVGIVAFRWPMIQQGPIKICSYRNC